MLPEKRAEAQKAALRRALEWRSFRDQFYLKQSDLAEMLGITVRTVCAIETGESLTPRAHVLRRFHDLRLKHERRRRREEALLDNREPDKSIEELLHYGKAPERLERLMSAAALSDRRG